MELIKSRSLININKEKVRYHCWYSLLHLAPTSRHLGLTRWGFTLQDTWLMLCCCWSSVLSITMSAVAQKPILTCCEAVLCVSTATGVWLYIDLYWWATFVFSACSTNHSFYTCTNTDICKHFWAIERTRSFCWCHLSRS